MQGDIETWWRSVPPITKFLFAGSFLLTIAANYGLISPYYLILDFPKMYKNIEIWRIVTCFLFHGKLGFNFLIHMLFLVRYGSSLEKENFNNTADYLFFMLFGCSILVVLSFFLDAKILGMSLIMMIIYYWSRKNPNIPMSFMFGLRFVSAYFPWVLIAFDMLLGQGLPIYQLLGVLVGHLYFFLVEIYPNNGGRRILSTPQFLYDLFPPQVQVNNNRQEGPRQPGYNWGAGHRLN